MNTDIRIQNGWYRHPKIIKLRRRLGAEGVLGLVTLWTWTGEQRPSGKLSGMDAEDIAIAAGYPEDATHFVETLLTLRLLDREDDGGLSIHDWEANNPYAANADWRHERAKKANAARREKAEQQSCYKPATSTLQAPLPTPSSAAPDPDPDPVPDPVPLVVLSKGSEVCKSAGAKQNATSAAAAASPPPTPSRINLGADYHWQNITPIQRELWQAAYPAVNLDTELAKAAAWIMANPTNRKSNWDRYLDRWFKRSQDYAPPSRQQSSRATRNNTHRPQPPSTPEGAKFDAILQNIGTQRPDIEGTCTHEIH